MMDPDPVDVLALHPNLRPAHDLLAKLVSQGKLSQCRNSVDFLGFRFLCTSTTMRRLIFM